MEDFSAECEETCSICLESFTVQNPSTTTVCKHEYHLQCIIEWSQRSRECPICWQSLSLSDPSSQELLAGPEVVRAARRQISPIRHFVPFSEFESPDAQDQHDAGDFDMEEYMRQQMRQHIQAIAMSRPHRLSSRREGATSLNQSQQLLPHTPSVARETIAPVDYQYSSGPSTAEGSMSALAFIRSNRVYSDNSVDASPPPPASPRNQNRGFSELASFSGSLKSKLSAASSKYKDSLSKGSRGLKEKLLVHNNSLKELSKEVKREVTAGFAGVARMMARLDLPSRSGDVGPNCSRGTSDVPCEDDGPKDKLTIHLSEVPDARKLPPGRRGTTQVHSSLP